MSDTHAQTVAYVRDTMLPPSEPPIAERGVVKWMRENLFSSWLNAILTVLGLLALWSLLAGIVPWFWQSVWNADSLSECREISDELYGAGEEVSSACMAVIRERWNQLMFGFYPQDLYWRPVAGLLVFIAAIAPVLFSGVPRKLVWFSAAAPFLIYWLMWGGSIGGPLAVALGFGVGYGAYVLGTRFWSPLAGTIAAIVVPLLYWLLLTGTVAGIIGAIIPLEIQFVPSKDFGGFMLSFIIGVSGIILSLPLGILLALGRQSNLFIINKCSVAFIEVFRGVPLIVWLFTASLLLSYFLPPGTNFDLMLRVIILVTLFSAAYIAEVVRGGLAALPRGQYEAADALGLDYWKAQRLIIMPQALKISIPGIVNTFIGLFKDTTLVVFIGLLDPIGMSNAIRADTAWQGVNWELFVFIGALFFICCFSMSRYSQYLERKLRTDHR